MHTAQRWYLVHTLPHREVSAALQLENQSFRTFLPKQLKTVRHARQLRTAIGAYFPRYLFVRLDLSKDRWRSVNGTVGVSRIVLGGDLPAPVPDGIVEALAAAADARGVLSGLPLDVGQRVRVVAGPFAEQVGTILRMHESGRVRVLLEIMGGHVPLEADREFLAAAG